MATKNNLDVGGEAPHHTELADRYRIEGAVYDLSQIIAAVKGEESNDAWNARTMGDRLDAAKAYLKSVDAEKVDETENTAGDGETVRDGNGNILEHPAQIAGSDGNDASGSGKATAIQGDTMSDEVEKLEQERDSLRDQIADVRAKLELKDDTLDLIEAVGALQEKASEAEQRATTAEQDASQLRDKVRRLEERSTRDKPLHGAVEDLKAPY